MAIVCAHMASGRQHGVYFIAVPFRSERNIETDVKPSINKNNDAAQRERERERERGRESLS